MCRCPSSPVRVKVTDWSCENLAPPLCAVYHLIGCCLCQSPSRLSCLLPLLSQSVSQWAALLRLSAPSWAHLTAGGFLSPPRSGPLQGADTQVRIIHLIRVKVLQVVSVKWRGLFWGHKKSQPALCHCSASEVSESLSRSVSRLLTRVLKFWKFHDVKLHTGNIYLHMYFKN